MIIIGVDPHPASHTAAALDAATGRVLSALRVGNTREGYERLLEWAGRSSGSHGGGDRPELRWAVEGAGNPFIAAWVADLILRGERVTNIPPTLTSQYRSRRGKKKNDEVDAANAARALSANPDLPAHDPPPISGVCRR